MTESRRALAAKELLRREHGKNTLAEFAQAIDVPGKPATDRDDEWLFAPVETVVAKHHILLMDTLDRVLSGEIKHLMVFFPPGSAKSTYASVVFPAYAMGKRPGTRLILASYASAIAWKQSRRTRQIVKSAKYATLFGASLREGNQSVNEWSLDNGSEYMASGLLAGLTGNRAHGLIVDDPVAGREDAESETMRRKTSEVYHEDAVTRLIPGGWEIIIQTRWAENDLSGGILPEDWAGESGFIDCRDGQKWYVLCVPAIADRADDPLGRKIGEQLWPEWFKPGHFDRFKNNPRAWSSLFQQKPRPQEGAEFQLSWVRKYLTPPKRLNKILLADPSSGRKKASGEASGDYTCIWVVGLAADRNAYVLDCIRDKLNLTQRIDAVFEMHRKHNPLQTRYEEYGLQADIEAIEREQDRQQYRFKITKVGGAVRKEDRIRRLIPWFENGLIYLPHVIPYRDVLGESHDLVSVFIKTEYAAFPVGRHDDMFDSLARIDEPALKLPWPKAEAYEPALIDYKPQDPELGY